MKTICFRTPVPVFLLLACATLRLAAAPLTTPPKAAPSPVVRPATVKREAQPQRQTPQNQALQRQTPQRQTPDQTRAVRPAAGSAAALQTLPNRQSSTRLAAPPTVTSPSVRQDVAPPIASPQLAQAIVESLNTNGVWVDPSLRGLADVSAIEQAAHHADFSVRVLVVRRVPGGFSSVQVLAQVVHQQLQLSDGLVMVATSDDARLGLFGAGLNSGTLNQIVEAGAQTWTQEGYAGGVAQTLRLVSYERKAQAQVRFLRVAVPGAIGGLCLLSAFALWLRRKIKHRARRAISKNLPTTIPTLNDDATSIESSSVEAI